MTIKILYIHWGIQIYDILWGLLELGEEAELYHEEMDILEYKEEQKERLAAYLQANSFEFVISANFIQSVSEACEEKGVRYLSWVFDSPQIDLYSGTAGNPNNYFFLFDRKQVERMKKTGLSHVYHLPLAANVARMSMLEFQQADVERFRHDISFVGGLYHKNRYNVDQGKYPGEVKEILDRHILEHVLKWKKGATIFPSFSQEEAEKLLPYAKLPQDIKIDPVYYLELDYLSRKISEIDRICCLNALALKQKVDLYTSEQTEALEGVRINGSVSYNEELPKIYFLSKINLNFTLRSIETGAPQRIFDVLGAGGFLMSNYQEELEELFVPDKEIVLFHSPEELAEQADYYLRHEEERRQIAMSGFQKVCENYTYPILLGKMLQIARG